MKWFIKLKKLLQSATEEPAQPSVKDLAKSKPVNPGSRNQTQATVNPSRVADVPTVIGIDFGTSSTKVAFRQLGDSRSWLLPAARSGQGLPWFCSPTTYQVKSGRVLFGAPSAAGSSNLKLKLLEQVGSPREFREVERCAVAYLGFILESSMPLILNHLDVDKIDPRFNIGVPMSYLGGDKAFESLLKKYIDVARAAIATTTAMGGAGIKQDMPIEDLERVVDDGIRRSAEVNTVWALPESISALVSLDTDPTWEPGAYTVLDIGAGTTDVSTSQVRENSGGGVKIACYDDSTKPHGVLAVEQSFGSGGTNKDAVHPLWHQWAASWDAAKRKDMNNPIAFHSWRNSTLLLAGGGGLHPQVQAYFKEMRNVQCPVKQSFQSEVRIEIYAPGEQALGSLGRPGDKRDDFHMGVVAHGLTYMRREWPQLFPPGEVLSLEPPPPFVPVPGKWV